MSAALDVLPAGITDIEVAEDPDDSVCEAGEICVGEEHCARQAVFRVFARISCSCQQQEWSFRVCIPHKDYLTSARFDWVCEYCPAPVIIIRIERV